MGKRGEGWVIGQFIIGIAIFMSVGFWRIELPLLVRVLGIALMIVGSIILGLGFLFLGENLTVFPIPSSERHALITTGIYRLVRHPIYSGVTFACFGWALWWGSGLGMILCGVLFVWFDFKARSEEKWLLENFSEYAAYRARVKKLIPFLY